MASISNPPDTLVSSFVKFTHICYGKLPVSAQGTLQKIQATWNQHKEIFVTAFVLVCALRNPHVVVYTALPTFILTIIQHNLNKLEGVEEGFWNTSLTSQIAKTELTASQVLIAGVLPFIPILRGVFAGIVLGQCAALLLTQTIKNLTPEDQDRLRASLEVVDEPPVDPLIPPPTE